MKKKITNFVKKLPKRQRCCLRKIAKTAGISLD